jgi:hypothetical protein
MQGGKMKMPEKPEDRYFNVDLFDFYYYFGRGDKPLRELAETILNYYGLKLLALVELVADAPSPSSEINISYVFRRAKKYYDLAMDLVSQIRSIQVEEFNLGDGEQKAIIEFLKRHKNIIVLRINDGLDIAYAIAREG